MKATREKVTSLESDVKEEINGTWAHHFQDIYETEENLVGADIDVMYSNFLKLMRKQMIGYKIEDKYSKVSVGVRPIRRQNRVLKRRTDEPTYCHLF